MPVCVFLAPGGFHALNFKLRLVAVDQFATFGLRIAFLDVLTRLKLVASGRVLLHSRPLKIVAITRGLPAPIKASFVSAGLCRMKTRSRRASSRLWC
ncbi:hypothetical protein SBA3_2090013 [Candidatus Sulfopaludibacter sp. SbA3]|nr:hypothetical protein SBA3_2090013 [Candidatus Sulfopaludibacter sp. SbA3]